MKRSAKIRWLLKAASKEMNPEVRAMIIYQILDSTKEAKEVEVL